MSRKNRRKKASHTAAVPEGTTAAAQPKKKKGPVHGARYPYLGLVPRRLCRPGLVVFRLVYPQLVGRRFCLYRPGYGSLALVSL